MNKVYLSGIVADEPRQVSAEGQVAHTVFLLSVRHKTGANIVKRELYRINAWNASAGFCKEHLAKGMRVALQGYLTQRVYQAGGIPVVSVEVAVDEVFLPSVRRLDDKPDMTPSEAQLDEQEAETEQEEEDEREAAGA